MLYVVTNNEAFTLRTTISAVVGGTAAALGGGKFANGAVSAAFVMMYNEMAHTASKSMNALTLLDKWAKGEGGEYYFGPDHPMTIDLQYSPKLQNAINGWIMESHSVGDSAFLDVDPFFPIGEGDLLPKI